MFLVTVILETYIQSFKIHKRRLLDFWEHFGALNLSLRKSQPYLFPTQPCFANILFLTLCLSPPASTLNTSKSALILLSAVSRHIPFHLFTTFLPPTKEPLYTHISQIAIMSQHIALHPLSKCNILHPNQPRNNSSKIENPTTVNRR